MEIKIEITAVVATSAGEEKCMSTWHSKYYAANKNFEVFTMTQ